MEKAKEKPPEFFKSTKTSLKSILKHPEINTHKINDVVIKAHKIVIHTLQFLKMYILHYYNTNSHTLPIIDKVLILNIMKVVCGEKHTNQGRLPKKETLELIENLTSFYTEHYKPYIQPSLTDPLMQFYRFLHTPPSLELKEEDYQDKSVEWNADVHIVATYAFLSDEEREKFAKDTHDYLFKDVQTYKFHNVTGSKNLKLESTGLVSNWIFHFQRSVVNLRNEWSNYSNWAYKGTIPQNVILAPQIDTYKFDNYDADFNNDPDLSGGIGAGSNPDEANNTVTQTFLTYTGNFNPENNEYILHEFGIKIDGNYRENKMERGIFEYLEPYRGSKGASNDGIYYYNFSVNTDNRDYQPSGAINLNKFKNIELEFTTYIPPLDPNAEVLTICDDDGNIIGINKSEWNIYKYNYDLTLYEEKYNIIHISSGHCGLMFAR